MKYPTRQGEYLYLSRTSRIAFDIHLDVRKFDEDGIDYDEPAGDYEDHAYGGPLTAKDIDAAVEALTTKRSKELGWDISSDGFRWIEEVLEEDGMYSSWDSIDRQDHCYNFDLKEFAQAVKDIKAFVKAGI